MDAAPALCRLTRCRSALCARRSWRRVVTVWRSRSSREPVDPGIRAVIQRVVRYRLFLTQAGLDRLRWVISPDVFGGDIPNEGKKAKPAIDDRVELGPRDHAHVAAIALAQSHPLR